MNKMKNIGIDEENLELTMNAIHDRAGETARALSLDIIRDNEGKRQRRTRDEGVSVGLEEVADADADEKRPGKTGERKKPG